MDFGYQKTMSCTDLRVAGVPNIDIQCLGLCQKEMEL